jgi:hypothetical protein
MLRTRHREDVLLQAFIEAQQRFVVDNINPTVAQRAKYITLANDAGFLASSGVNHYDLTVRMSPSR